MGDLWEKIKAKGRGAAQIATAGYVDEIYPKILASLPMVDDGTGIPRYREIDGTGDPEAEYRAEYKADDAEAARKWPRNFADGGMLAAAPQMLATGGLGAAGQVGAGVGMGALQAAGASENTGKELAKDAVRGGALGGAFGAAGNLVSAAAPAAKAAFEKLRQGPPGGMQPAMAGASSGLRSVPREAEQMGGVQINQARKAPTLQSELGRLEDRFAAGKIDQGEFKRLTKDAEARFGSTPEPAETVVTQVAPAASPKQQTIEEILSSFPSRERVRLHEIRAKMGGDRASQDAALFKAQQDGRLNMMRIDDPTDIGAIDNEAALHVAGFPRHIAYIEPGAGAQEQAMSALKARKFDPSKYDNIGDAPSRAASPPPRPNTADLSDVMAESPEQGAIRAIEGRDSLPPLDVNQPLPKNAPWKHFNGVPDEEVDLLEQRLRQTEANGQKKIEARIEDRNNPRPVTARPGKRGAR